VSLSIQDADPARIHVLLLDIEGTTTPIDFVYKTLFPYASRKAESFLREHSGEDEIAALVRDLRAQHETDEASGLQPTAWRDDSGGEATILSAIEYVLWLMARDGKCTPLKALQGKIWQQGFDSGELHGEVYDDVPRGFARWRRQGREICIYSSGSVLAQQMLFRTVVSGDLTVHIAGFFDTQIGIKTAAESYRKIAASLGREVKEILFLSDAPKEIEASIASGMYGIMCDRNAQVEGPLMASRAIHSFDEVFPD
jgi:enolase-phosphatase E1